MSIFNTTPICFQAEACKSFSQAVKKCPSGMFAEIKYDGERVQVSRTFECSTALCLMLLSSCFLEFTDDVTLALEGSQEWQ